MNNKTACKQPSGFQAIQTIDILASNRLMEHRR